MQRVLYLTSLLCAFCFFFFSSRRRHTRFDCDWSSDVCSSDLGPQGAPALLPRHAQPAGPPADHRHIGLRGHRRDERDRKSTRLNSSHSQISYAVFCLKKKKNRISTTDTNNITTLTSRSGV